MLNLAKANIAKSGKESYRSLLSLDKVFSSGDKDTLKLK